MTKEEIFEDLKIKIRNMLLQIEPSDVIFDTHGERAEKMEGRWALLFDYFPIDDDVCVEVRKISHIADRYDSAPFFSNHDTDHRFCVDLLFLGERLSVDLSNFRRYIGEN